MAKAASSRSHGQNGSFAELRTPGHGSDAHRRASGLAREVARLAREILAPSVEVIWFGSWPRGRAHERSDIDIAIRAAEPIPRDRLRRLRDAVDELPALYSIDVVDLRDASPLLRAEIERDGQLL